MKWYALSPYTNPILAVPEMNILSLCPSVSKETLVAIPITSETITCNEIPITFPSLGSNIGEPLEPPVPIMSVCRAYGN